MNKPDYRAETEMLLHTGLLNTYQAGRLLDMPHQHLDEQLWDESIKDAIEATKAGVDSDEELAEFFVAPKTKLAYPNVGKLYKALPKYDTKKWAELVGRIKDSAKMGFGKNDAIVEASTELPEPERLDFLNWYKMQDSEIGQKYNLNDQIKQKSRQRFQPTHASYEGRQEGRMDELTKVAEMADDRHYYVPRFRNEPPAAFDPQARYKPTLPEQNAQDGAHKATAPDPKVQNAKDFESARQKLVSRTFSIDKLLEKYKRVLSPDQVDGIEDSLNELRKKIRKLKLAISIRDSMVKTAGIIGQFDFEEGAQELLALAADEAVMPDGVAQPEEVDTMSAQKKNEALTKIVEMLNTVSVTLKSRDLIRQIAEIDILLDNLRMASFFPEMQDAQAKLIDAFGYASNKIEDALPKLRGGLMGQQPDEIPTKPGKTDQESLQQLQDITKGKGGKQPQLVPEEPAALPEKAHRNSPLKSEAPAEQKALPPELVKKPAADVEDEESDKIRELQLPVRRQGL